MMQGQKIIQLFSLVQCIAIAITGVKLGLKMFQYVGKISSVLNYGFFINGNLIYLNAADLRRLMN